MTSLCLPPKGAFPPGKSTRERLYQISPRGMSVQLWNVASKRAANTPESGTLRDRSLQPDTARVERTEITASSVPVYRPAIYCRWAARRYNRPFNRLGSRLARVLRR